MPRRRLHHPRDGHRRQRGLAAAAAAVALVAAAPGGAAWSATGSGGGAAKATSLAAGNVPTPTAPPLSFNVTVSWAASTGPGGGPVDGYVVRRYAAAGVVALGGCAGTVSGTSCVETGVPAGAWKYTVAPVLGAWQGGESGFSANVVVPG